MLKTTAVAFRPATEADAAELLRWRNDPITRYFRPRANIVTMEEHLAWLKRRQASPSKVYIFERDNIPMGNITLDVEDGRCEIGWIVAPEHRRKGVASDMARMALLNVPEGHEPWAKMRRDNIASQKVAEAIGMRRIRRDGDMVIYGRPLGI